MDRQQQDPRISPETAAKNRRLAIILALIAVGFYVGFVLMHLRQ